MQAMWEWVFDAVVPWAPAALLVTAPWLTALLALAIQRVAQRHLESRGPTLPVEAGPWAVVAAARHGVRVPVERHPGGVDAYWPSPGAIGLSVATWHGRSAVRYAIAAHELGHAWNATLHPALPDLLPVARLVQTHAWRAAVAGGLVGGLLALPFVLDLAWYAGFVALAASLAVLTDELSASRRGISALAGDPLVPREAVTIAQAAMCTAGTVYAAIAVGQFGVLAAWPQAAPYVLTLGSPAPPTVPAVWLLVLTLPLLVLRAVQLGLQVWRPEPVTTGFRLFATLHRDSSWESMIGLLALGLVVGLHGLSSGPVWVACLWGAAFTAVGPAAAVVRGLVLMPVLAVLASSGDPSGGGGPSPDRPPPALLALYDRPPWYVRVAWAIGLAWLPLVALGSALLLAG